MRKKLAGALIALLTLAATWWGVSIEPATAAPGDGFAVGLRTTQGALGSHRVVGRQAFCIDLNGGGPAPVTGWTTRQLSTSDRKQVGMSKADKGAAGARGARFNTAELSRLSWLLDQAAVSALDATSMAATEVILREITSGDAVQRRRASQRYEAARAVSQTLAGRVDALRAQMLREAGPYRLELAWTRRPSLTQKGEASVVLRSASGAVLEHPVDVRWGSTRLRVSRGLVTVPAGPVRAGVLTATASLPGVAPDVVVPKGWTQTRSPDRLAQRMIARPSAQVLSAQLTASVGPAQPTITTVASSATAQTGEALYDTVRVGGEVVDTTTVTATLFGPYAQAPTAKDCQPRDPQVGAVTLTVSRTGEYRTPALTVSRPGYYVWHETMPATARQKAVTTPCGIAAEMTLVTAPPAPTPSPLPTPTPRRRSAAPLPVRQSVSPSPQLSEMTSAIATPHHSEAPLSSETPDVRAIDQPIIRAGERRLPLPVLALLASIGLAVAGLLLR